MHSFLIIHIVGISRRKKNKHLMRINFNKKEKKFPRTLIEAVYNYIIYYTIIFIYLIKINKYFKRR
jgi:hypothetical protein